MHLRTSNLLRPQVLPISFTFLPASYFSDLASNHPHLRHPPQAVLDAYETAKQQLGLQLLEPFPVHHVSRSTGLKIVGSSSGQTAQTCTQNGQNGAQNGQTSSQLNGQTSADGSSSSMPGAPWSVVFSGDTRPCAAVIDAARRATLLIHEATFEDELGADAVAKRHSTLSEALGVARDSGVYRTVLTHFSGRYPKIPVLAQEGVGGSRGDGEAEGDDEGMLEAGEGEEAAARAPLLSMVGRSVMVGFDFMTVNLADLPWLPLLVPACDELLREEGFVTEEDERAEGEGA